MAEQSMEPQEMVPDMAGFDELNITAGNMTDDDYMDLMDLYPQYKAQIYIQKIIYPLLLVIGTIGNCLAFLIMRKFSKRVTSTCLYLTVLAVVDTIELYVRCGNEWLRTVAKIDLSSTLLISSAAVCKVYTFILNFVSHLAQWYIVALATECFISMWNSKKAHWMCTYERAVAVTLLLTVILVFVNGHFFWTYVLIKPSQTSEEYTCSFNDNAKDFKEIYRYLEFVGAECVPLGIVLVLTIFMIIRLVQKKEFTQPERTKFYIDPTCYMQCLKIFFSTCVLFIVCSVMSLVFEVYRYLSGENQDPEIVDIDSVLNEGLANEIVKVIPGFVLRSCKFFIYVSCSACFRRELRWLFSKGCRCGRRRGSMEVGCHQRKPLINSASKDSSAISGVSTDTEVKILETAA
ncbi:uncharacterized protein LOC106158336 isoform X2 [Lingula anatina]|uniref:Uncharacterized protein LOC106158336 isoform X2 n=1 Tax=Lingula anatina TaxID=7574 RepID=A0A1S3HUM4_LINAN|nr:uncharacterized protein LOC106158336 isoform X2 [Lingula anatina]|eukprot:XP_013389718.1 uncharacterized protein LOC106158336 isoform X2 [Lingula anatina]